MVVEVVAILAEAVVAADQVEAEVIAVLAMAKEVAASRAKAKVAAVQVEVVLAMAEETATIQATGAEDRVFADEVHIALEAAHPQSRSEHLDCLLCEELDTLHMR